MEKKVLGFLSIVILTMIMTGCGGDEKSVQNGNLSVTSESVESVTSSEETVSEIDAINDTEETVTETDTANVEVQEKNLTQFESDFGYSIDYEEDSFDYRRTEGYDEFVLKSDAVDKPFVFVCVSCVGAEFVEQVKMSALGENPESCTIGQTQMQGQCSEIEEDWDGGKVIHKTYMCMLDSGDALLIETQWYTEQADDPYAAWLWEMVNSISFIDKPEKKEYNF